VEDSAQEYFWGNVNFPAQIHKLGFTEVFTRRIYDDLTQMDTFWTLITEIIFLFLVEKWDLGWLLQCKDVVWKHHVFWFNHGDSRGYLVRVTRIYRFGDSKFLATDCPLTPHP
jgi:hypothetical protein